MTNPIVSHHDDAVMAPIPAMTHAGGQPYPVRIVQHPAFRHPRHAVASSPSRVVALRVVSLERPAAATQDQMAAPAIPH